MHVHPDVISVMYIYGYDALLMRGDFFEIIPIS